MQTGRSTLLGRDDVENVQHLQEVFKLGSEEEAAELAQFSHFSSIYIFACGIRRINNVKQSYV